MTTPPLPLSARTMSSVILRGWPEIARMDECDATSGALLVSIASQNVLSETWEMSTITPRRFSSRTTSLPKAVVDHVTAFHPHQRRDPAGLVRRPHFRGRRRQRDLVRVLLDEPPDVIDEDQRALHRFGAGDGAGHV